MWQIKTFKTKEQMDKWIEINKNHVQYQEVFINNGYAVDYRILKKVFYI